MDGSNYLRRGRGGLLSEKEPLRLMNDIDGSASIRIMFMMFERGSFSQQTCCSFLFLCQVCSRSLFHSSRIWYCFCCELSVFVSEVCIRSFLVPFISLLSFLSGVHSLTRCLLHPSRLVCCSCLSLCQVCMQSLLVSFVSYMVLSLLCVCSVFCQVCSRSLFH